ncbi:MAG: LPS export ABC transporter permease LptF [Deltaproteobacteria bacterium]|nr:LPS export ABC transporter permease LptF [Deltaproteobacteria bacterium]
MQKIPILYRYIFREVLIVFSICLFVFTGILFLIRSLKLLDMVINKDVPLLDIILLFSYIIPRFLEIAIPMSLLLALILAFGRLSADSELVVVKASGISIHRLVIPVFAFAGLCTGLTFAVAMIIRPYATYQLNIGMFQIAKNKATSGLVAGIFNELSSLTMYAQDINYETKRMDNVIIADRQDEKNPRTFLAKNGHLLADNAARSLFIRLYNGSIQEGFGKSLRYTTFDVNNINIDQDTLSDDDPLRGGKRTREMYLHELNNSIHSLRGKGELEEEERQQLGRYLSEFHYRFALPLSCLCVALVAMALGIQPARGSKQWGMTANIIVGISLIFVFYILMAVADAIAAQGNYPAWALIWIPDLLFALLAGYLYRQICAERWVTASDVFVLPIQGGLAKLGLLSPEKKDA